MLYEQHPWTIDDDDLRVITFKYTVPSDLYETAPGMPAGDLE